MKNKIAIASAFFAASSFSFAEIALTPNLSVEGFVDMSYSHTDQEINNRKASDNSYAIDQVEISWLFDFSPVTAQIDLEYEEGDDDNGEVEQAFITYDLGGGSALTAGRFASMLGFEAFEPTGLYQYSFAYEIGEFKDPIAGTLFADDLSILPSYAQGVKYTYKGDTSFFGISLQDEAFDNDADHLGGGDDSTYAVEAAAAFDLGNGFGFFIGGVFESGDDDADADTYNTYVTYETGAWLFAAELNYGENEGAGALSRTLPDGVSSNGNPLTDPEYGEEETTQFLLMANYAYSDKASITARYTYSDHEVELTATETISDDPDTDGVDESATPIRSVSYDGKFSKYTLAHNYAFTDNLVLITELSWIDGESDATGIIDVDVDSTVAAVELIFTF